MVEKKELEIIKQDGYLKPYESIIENRQKKFYDYIKEIENNEKSLIEFSQSYKNMGLHALKDNSLSFREYAPGAKAISIVRRFDFFIFLSLEILIFGTEKSITVRKIILGFSVW